MKNIIFCTLNLLLLGNIINADLPSPDDIAPQDEMLIKCGLGFNYHAIISWALTDLQHKLHTTTDPKAKKKLETEIAQATAFKKALELFAHNNCKKYGQRYQQIMADLFRHKEFRGVDSSFKGLL